MALQDRKTIRTQRGCLTSLVVGLSFTLGPTVLSAQIMDASQSQSMQQQQQQQSPSQQQQQPGMGHGSASVPAQQNSIPGPGVTGEEMKDKIFLRKAAQGGLAEVKLGQLAAEKGSSDAVKSFGNKMVTDHTLLDNQMKPVADSMGVRLPKDLSKEDQAEFDKLNALTGDEFDREYILTMVKDHRKDMREFRVELTATTDPTLKDAVEQGEKVIREHLHLITQIAKDQGIPIPGRPGATTSPQM
jgi:putative membrane protein